MEDDSAEVEVGDGPQEGVGGWRPRLEEPEGVEDENMFPLPRCPRDLNIC